jgi:tetratricopeptide (TPR) repeat protein
MGLSVVEETLDEGGAITEFTQLPGIDTNIARRLIDAGYVDLESLYNAGKDELLRVRGINEEIANQVKEYTRTVEFSQRVVVNKSQKWLRKGREQARTGVLDRAIKSIERALEIDPKNASAWLELSQLAELEGRKEESREYYEKAREINPGLGGAVSVEEQTGQHQDEGGDDI